MEQIVFFVFAIAVVITLAVIIADLAKTKRDLRLTRKAFAEFGNLFGIKVSVSDRHFSFASGGPFGGDITKNPASRAELQKFINECGERQEAVEKHLGIKLVRVEASVEKKPAHFAVEAVPKVKTK